MAKSTYYLTTAIPYANADPHIGFALEILYADVMARYQRLLGNEVYFLTGTDEHGQKMLKTAKENNQAVADYAALKSAQFSNLADEWDISNNDFIRTTEDRHKQRAAAFWQASQKNGDIYKKSYEGLYCIGCESFKTEKDLVNGQCPIHGTTPEKLQEENYFFKLSRYQEALEVLFTSTPNFVLPKNRQLEMYNILKDGLDDISISRAADKLPWGITVPGDPTQVMYVWFDALTNYITALGYGSNDQALYQKFWPGIHLIGKDIARFHALLWPAMLLSAGLEVPQGVVVHGFINVNGQKMSKSIGNVINPFELTQKYPLDAVRYFFMREVPFDNDGNYSDNQFAERYNGDLANGLGNLTNRVLTMIEKYCANHIPAVTNINHDLINFLTQEIWPAYQSNMQDWRFDRALEAVNKYISHCDQIISDRAPWSLYKEGKLSEVNDLLYHLAESLRHVAFMVWPIMPSTAEKLLESLGLVVENELAKPLKDLNQWVGIEVGTPVTKAPPLFPRLNAASE